MLNIITACIRASNLEKIHESILKAKEPYSNVDIAWYIVAEGRVLPTNSELRQIVDTKKLQFNNTITTHIIVNDTYQTHWESPVNIALEHIKSGLVCIIDDDNIMHPEFIEYIYPKYLSGIKGFIYHQQLSKNKTCNNIVRIAKRANIAPGKIDTAQFSFDRSLVENDSWCPKSKQPDGYFISSVYAKKSSEILILDRILCYYNYLQDDNPFN